MKRGKMWYDGEECWEEQAEYGGRYIEKGSRKMAGNRQEQLGYRFWKKE